MGWNEIRKKSQSYFIRQELMRLKGHLTKNVRCKEFAKNPFVLLKLGNIRLQCLLSISSDPGNHNFTLIYYSYQYIFGMSSNLICIKIHWKMHIISKSILGWKIGKWNLPTFRPFEFPLKTFWNIQVLVLRHCRSIHILRRFYSPFHAALCLLRVI